MMDIEDAHAVYDSLRNEIERLRAKIGEIEDLQREREELRNEIERLTRERDVIKVANRVWSIEQPMKRLWGIRHIRWLWLSWRVHRFARQCAQIGLGLGWPNSSDLEFLDAVWRGEE